MPKIIFVVSMCVYVKLRDCTERERECVCACVCWCVCVRTCLWVCSLSLTSLPCGDSMRVVLSCSFMTSIWQRKWVNKPIWFWSRLKSLLVLCYDETFHILFPFSSSAYCRNTSTPSQSHAALLRNLSPEVASRRPEATDTKSISPPDA